MKEKNSKPRQVYKTMSIAVSSGKMGMVLFMNRQLVVLKSSIKAAKSTEQAAKQMQVWIEKYSPDVIVTEQLNESSRKHGRTIDIMQTILEVVQSKSILHVEVKRQHNYANKHEEAQALSDRYLQLQPYLPSKRKIWEAEDRRMMLFEAVSNAVQTI